MRDAAAELCRATHKVRSDAYLKLQNSQANASSEVFQNQVAQTAWDEWLLHESAYQILFSCGRQLLSSAAWATETVRGITQWSTMGRKACVAMGRIQGPYCKVQDAAMLLPGSEGHERKGYLSCINDPKKGGRTGDGQCTLDPEELPVGQPRVSRVTLLGAKRFMPSSKEILPPAD